MSWRDRAACKGKTAVVYGETAFNPKALCERCPVRAECLADGLAVETKGFRHGVWGGLEPAERDRVQGTRLASKGGGARKRVA